MKKVLIIGAGIGGLSAAIQLAFHKYDVTVLEKSHQPGGKINQTKHNGFTFDTGASFIMAKEIYDDFFNSVDRKVEKYITLKKLTESSKFFFANGKTFSLSTDANLIRKQISELFPGDEKGLDQFNKIGKEIYELMYHGPKLARRNYNRFFGFDYIFDPRVISKFHHLRFWQTWEQLVNKCFKSNYLRQIFSYQSTFVGMTPSEALATYSFLTWMEITQGLYEVQGGVYGIIQGFYKLASELGVKFEFNQEVMKLNTVENKIISVSTKTDNFNADIFINNGDAAYFYINLLPKNIPTQYTENSFKKMKHSCTFFTINLGIKKPIPKLSHHSIFFSNQPEDNFKLINTPNSINKFNFDNFSYYLTQPTLSQPSLAPKGKAVLFILAPVCGYDPKLQWSSYENNFKEFIYDVMEKRDHIPIRSLIEEEIVISPAQWGQQYNLWENIILGPGHNFFQVNGFRIPNKSKEIDNLFFVGGSTIPGAGVPTCITSGELVTERIVDIYHPCG